MGPPNKVPNHYNSLDGHNKSHGNSGVASGKYKHTNMVSAAEIEA